MARHLVTACHQYPLIADQNIQLPWATHLISYHRVFAKNPTNFFSVWEWELINYAIVGVAAFQEQPCISRGGIPIIFWYTLGDRYILLSVSLRWNLFLPLYCMQYKGFLSVDAFLYWWACYNLNFILLWSSNRQYNVLGLRHETTVCTVCFTMFLWEMNILSSACC